MTMRTDTWMPLFIGDYLADTMHLTAEEHGAYLLLIMHYWRTGEPIKNDKNLIKNIAKVSIKKLENVLKFFEEKEGFLHHKRIDEELSNSLERKQKAVNKAKLAAEKRWGNKDAPSNATSIGQAMHEECPSPSSSPTTIVVLTDDEDKAREQKIKIPEEERIKIFREISGKIQDEIKGALPINTQRVHAWIDAGADEDLIIETIRTVMAKRNNEPVNSLKYFDSAIATAIYNKTKPLNMEQANVNETNRRSTQKDGYTKPSPRSQTDRIINGINRIAEKYSVSDS